MFEENAPKLANYFIGNHKKYISLWESRDDMFQSLLLYAWQKRDNYDESRGSYSNFLINLYKYAVMRKGCEVGKKKVETISIETPIGDGLLLEDTISDGEDIAKNYEMQEIMGKLSKNSYQYYVEGLNLQEIGEKEGKSKECIRKRIIKEIDKVRCDYVGFEM